MKKNAIYLLTWCEIYFIVSLTTTEIAMLTKIENIRGQVEALIQGGLKDTSSDVLKSLAGSLDYIDDAISYQKEYEGIDQSDDGSVDEDYLPPREGTR